MRYRVASATLVALLVGGTMPAAATPSPDPGASTVVVPPAAPTPTDSGNSPAAPDPHPGRGGLDPDGQAVGGARLLTRKNVLPSGAPALPADLTARSWMVTDLDTGEIIAARDPHGRYQAASIQKILTTVALLPLLPGGRTVVVSKGAAETEGSHAGLVTGGTYTIDQIFQGLLLVSGNDCAEALAEAAGGRAQTVALMNHTALDLGAYDTLVQTPSGLDGWQQLTSAYDMTLFLRAALAQPRFLAYDNLAKARLPKQQIDGYGPVSLYNQNEQFLTTVDGAIAAKTGFTDAAQHTFAGAIKRGGHRYGVILLRAQRYPDDQWVQATNLVKWATSLPAGTAAVGRLETPTARQRAATTPPPSPGASRSATPRAVEQSGTSSGSLPLWAQVLAALVLIGGGLALARRLTRTR